MESFGIIGFVFGVSALVMVIELKKTVKSLEKQIEELQNK